MTTTSATIQPTPMDWIFEARSYGMKIRYTTMADGKIDWQGDRISYQRIQFNIQQLRDLAYGLIIDTRRLMRDLLLFKDNGDEALEFPAINWAKLEDNYSKDRVDYSFISDDRNQWTVEGQSYILKQICNNSAFRDTWIGADGDPNTTAIRQYGLMVERFREIILVAIYITGGQPPQGPELLGMRIINTTQEGQRNVFIQKGLVYFTTIYHKNYRSKEQIKLIHRFLPPELGELLILYLWLVLPFWQRMGKWIKNGGQESAFLWATEIITTTVEEQGK
jgi:hypothetical protein